MTLVLMRAAEPRLTWRKGFGNVLSLRLMLKNMSEVEDGKDSASIAVNFNVP